MIVSSRPLRWMAGATGFKGIRLALFRPLRGMRTTSAELFEAPGGQQLWLVTYRHVWPFRKPYSVPLKKGRTLSVPGAPHVAYPSPFRSNRSTSRLPLNRHITTRSRSGVGFGRSPKRVAGKERPALRPQPSGSLGTSKMSFGEKRHNI